MDGQAYLDAIEQQFEKSEYITLKKLTVKLLTAPRSPAAAQGRLYCFVVRDCAPSDTLCTELVRYALSLSFYEDTARRDKDRVLVLFLVPALCDSARALLARRCRKIGSALCLPAVFDLSQKRLYCAAKRPIFGSRDFETLRAFAEKYLQPSTEE